MRSLTLVAAVAVAAAHLAAVQQAGLPLGRLKLPPGFSISVFSSQVPDARSMTVSPSGTLFVGTRARGSVYALQDRNKDGKADEVITIARRLNSPNGVAFRNGSLYVAEISRVIRFDNIETSLRNPAPPAVVNDSFPRDQSHGWKFMALGPDNMLYVNVGSATNSCQQKDRADEFLLPKNLEAISYRRNSFCS